MEITDELRRLAHTYPERQHIGNTKTDDAQSVKTSGRIPYIGTSQREVRSSVRSGPHLFRMRLMSKSEKHERLCRMEKSNAPTSGELLLEIPQDDQEFERLSLPERPLNF